jgi:hypothetical protein
MPQPSDSSTLESDEFARRSLAPAARPAPARQGEGMPAPPVDEELEDEVKDDETDAGDEETEEEVLPPSLKIGAALRGASSLFTSLVVHLAILVGLALWMQPEVIQPVVHEVVSRLEEPPKDDLKVELDERFDPQTNTDRTSSSAFVPQVGMSDGGGPLGATGSGGANAIIKTPEYDASVRAAVEAGEITIEAPLAGLPAPSKIIAATPDGALGNPRAIVDSYAQAMDQITQEIVWFMDKSNVLVVWCFDQSESMKDDQQEIRERIERVYTDLGLTAHEANRLTTAVASYGSGFALHTPSPTSDRAKIRAAIDSVPVDPSGQELMCEAVGRSIAHHREYAQKTGRQMLLILVTDESGDVPNNNSYLEQAIAEAKAAKCRCYVLGREAVFGYPYAYISWQHPQTKHVHWLQIDRGPETAFVEQLQTDGFHRRYDAHPSGFGPYEQTRLARETGGIFFMLPSLETNLVHGEKRRYELEKMRAYRPDLRSRIEIVSERDDSLLRRTVWKIIYDLNPYQPDISQIIEMRVHFSPQYTQLVLEARREQAKAIVYLEYLARMQKVAEKLAKAREDELSPRWQANYDLVYAQLIAYQARMYEYGAYLEYFIKNPKVVPATKDPNLTHVLWDIRTREKTLTKESVPYIEKATKLYERIIQDHPGTPWAARAELELKRGFGVELIEHYEPPYPVIPPGTVLKPIPKL